MTHLFRDIKYLKMNSIIARRLLRFYYKDGKAYTIPFGGLRGMKLRYHSAVDFHAMLGLWDLDVLETLADLIKKTNLADRDISVCDIGANIGLYSLWFSRHLKGKGKIYAFEPVPSVLGMLKDNIMLNSISNIEIIPSACSNTSGRAKLFLGNNYSTSSFSKDRAKGNGIEPENIEVGTVSLRDFFKKGCGKKFPGFIKIDVEGWGSYVLEGCGNEMVAESRPFIFIESHTPEEDTAISRFIIRNDYKAFSITGRRQVNKPKEIYPQPEGVWGALLLYPKEESKHCAW